MARKQARKRKPKKVERRMPRIRWGLVVKPLFAIAVVATSYELSGRLLDRPVESIEISGPMQRVSVVEIEDAIDGELEAGFFGSDLKRMREAVQRLQWIDQAAVARRWPNRISIAVTEQTPAAVWDESGLMNVRGELFVQSGAQHAPAELPRLSGPQDRAADVARRYLDLRERLVASGIDVSRVELDARGAWDVTLSNGVSVRLGRRDVDARVDLLVGVVADVIAARAADIRFVDLRYSSGFTVGWKAGTNVPLGDPDAEVEEMLALRGME